MGVDVLIEDPRWTAIGLDKLALQAAHATLAELTREPGAFELSVLGCNDARIAALNEDFRDTSQPTNVLSWPSAERGAAVAGASPDLPNPADEAELGDIAIAYDTCLREADAAGKRLQDHVTHLLVHGVLHLLGYDHIRDKDATLMEQLEARILGKLGLPDPY